MRCAAPLIAAWFVVASAHAPAAIDQTTLAVVINDNDSASRTVGSYYASARGIPAAHVVHVQLPTRTTLSETEFRALADELAIALPESIQAIAATWLEPSRVECMSITSALALGFDRRYCAEGCARTLASPLYASTSVSPYSDFGIRPAMLLSAGPAGASKALIDRAVAARVQSANAFLVTSGDANRDVRADAFARLESAPPARVHVIARQGFAPLGARPLFYFTGAIRVPDVATFNFEPGAIADHVTSAGAIFDQRGQMTAIEWLQAGATGSYGTVVEPCNFPEKFPNPDIVVRRYAAGGSLIEAYWSSVRTPGQGLFVGEPLARPFAADPQTRAAASTR